MLNANVPSAPSVEISSAVYAFRCHVSYGYLVLLTFALMHIVIVGSLLSTCMSLHTFF